MEPFTPAAPGSSTQGSVEPSTGTSAQPVWGPPGALPSSLDCLLWFLPPPDCFSFCSPDHARLPITLTSIITSCFHSLQSDPPLYSSSSVSRSLLDYLSSLPEPRRSSPPSVYLHFTGCHLSPNCPVFSPLWSCHLPFSTRRSVFCHC